MLEDIHFWADCYIMPAVNLCWSLKENEETKGKPAESWTSFGRKYLSVFLC